MTTDDRATAIKKGWLIVGGSIVLIAIGLFLLTHNTSSTSDTDILEMFDCNRATSDSRATDIYCENPSLYREHLQKNKVISN